MTLSVPTGRPVIVVMVKAPRPGAAKTRLTPPLSPPDAAGLAAAFAQDAVANARGACPDVLVAYAPADGRETLGPLLPPETRWIEQRGADLGARLDAAVTDAEAQGYGPIVVIGTDSPTLPHSYVQLALEALTEGDADLTLGPTDDGGYYLVGTRRHVPGLFTGIAWSTPAAFAQTLAGGKRLGLRPQILPPWYDVDTYDDLTRLNEEFTADPSRKFLAPSTWAWLQTHPLG